MLWFEAWEWDDDRESHVWRHRVHAREVEEVCDGNPQVYQGREGLHVILGRTESGRYLSIIVRDLGHGRVRCVTARDMTKAERRRYRRR